MSDIDWSQFKEGDEVEFAYDDGKLRIEKSSGKLAYDTDGAWAYLSLNSGRAISLPKSGLTSITKAEPPIIPGDWGVDADGDGQPCYVSPNGSLVAVELDGFTHSWSLDGQPFDRIVWRRRNGKPVTP